VIDVAVLGIGNTVGEILYFDELQVAAKGGEAGDDPERIRSPFEPPPRVATPVPTQARFGTLYPSGGKPRIGTHPPAIGANPSSKGAPSGGIDWMGPRGNNNAANSGRGNRGNQGKPWRMSWDWAVDFSAAQGQNNWHYREWDGKEYRDLTWSAAENAWLGVGRDTAKAGRKEVRIEQGKLKPEQNDAALTWVAGRPGTVAVTGAAKKFNTKTGDGVYVGILMNDKDVLWQKTLAFNDGQGAAHAINVSVQTGDTIVFRVNQRGNSSADMVEWNPKIAYVN
jgi:hypothetical protein